MVMQAKYDLVGKRFGRLRVVGKAHTHISPNGTRKSQWLVVCNCGKETVVQGTRLRAGTTVSCGCIRSEVNQEQAKKLAASQRGKPKNRVLLPYQWLYNVLLKASRKFAERCDIQYNDFITLIAIKICGYCGEPIEWPSPYSTGLSKFGYNLDRKDNKRGYTRDNVIVCCKTCNVAKGNRYTYLEWVAMTEALRRVRQGNTHVEHRLVANLPAPVSSI